MVDVIGLGYIGLPTALMMASHGMEVVGTNHSQGKVDMLKKRLKYENKTADPKNIVVEKPKNNRKENLVDYDDEIRYIAFVIFLVFRTLPIRFFISLPFATAQDTPLPSL